MNTLRQYIKDLQEFAKDYPETLDLKVVYSHDDGGNAYQEINTSNGGFAISKGYHEDRDFTYYGESSNAVLIN